MRKAQQQLQAKDRDRGEVDAQLEEARHKTSTLEAEIEQEREKARQKKGHYETEKQSELIKRQDEMIAAAEQGEAKERVLEAATTELNEAKSKADTLTSQMKQQSHTTQQNEERLKREIEALQDELSRAEADHAAASTLRLGIIK